MTFRRIVLRVGSERGRNRRNRRNRRNGRNGRNGRRRQRLAGYRAGKEGLVLASVAVGQRTQQEPLYRNEKPPEIWDACEVRLRTHIQQEGTRLVRELRPVLRRESKPCVREGVVTERV